MGPQVDRLVEDGLSKNFDIVADIEEEAGRLPEPPQILVDLIEEEKLKGKRRTRINVRFTGPLAQAQRKLFTLRPIKSGLSELALASELFPNITDRVDENLLSEAILDSADFPQKLMRSTEEVEDIRQAREAAAAQQQQLQNLTEVAEAVPKLSKAMEPESPLRVMAGAA